MNLIISEKQLELLLSKTMEIDEEDQSGTPAYPEVGKWESGVTRGPSNQIAVTKWSDIVGSKITRGKANPIK